MENKKRKRRKFTTEFKISVIMDVFRNNLNWHEASRKYCEFVAEMTCVGATGLILYYTVPLTAVNTVIGNLSSSYVCDYIAKNVCKDEQDCHNVEECDTVCSWQSSGDIQPGECVDTPTGTLCH